MSIVILILFIAYIISWVFVLFHFIFRKKFSQDPIQCYTGSLGQGKSLIGSYRVITTLKSKRFLWLLGVLKSKQIPVLYSNIPMVFKNSLVIRFLAIVRGIKLPKYENRIQLKYEHIVMIEEVVEYSSVYIDEIGDIADQYSYDNPLVVEFLQTFIRFFRHFIDGTIVFTDQAVDNVTKPIRVRIGKVYHLLDFRRFLFHWYKVSVLDVMLTEDVQTINSSQFDEPPYFFGHLPYKYLKFLDWTRFFTFKRYETRCYKPLYEFANILEKELDINGGLFTKYVISLPNTQAMKKQYKSTGIITRAEMMEYLKQWQLSKAQA